MLSVLQLLIKYLIFILKPLFFLIFAFFLISRFPNLLGILILKFSLFLFEVIVPLLSIFVIFL